MLGQDSDRFAYFYFSLQFNFYAQLDYFLEKFKKRLIKLFSK